MLIQLRKKHLLFGIVVGVACITVLAIGLGVGLSKSSSSVGTTDSVPIGELETTAAVSSGVHLRFGGVKKPSQCHELPNPGECRGSFPRFFYNSSSDQCDCFLYGGCDDEEPQSSWLTLADCSATCQPGNVDEGPRCTQILNQEDIQTFKRPSIAEIPDLSHVNDTALLDMFGDDQSSPQGSPSVCQFPFIYNNVSYSKCTTKDDPDGEPWCSTRTDSHNNHIKDNWIICSSAGQTTSGIGVSGKPVQCETLPNPGECRGSFPRFFYNATSDQCDCFLYGGCDDEEPQSSWLTLADCSATCQPDNAEEGPRCKQILNQEDIQTFKRPNIVDAPDLSHLNDTALLDMFGDYESTMQESPSMCQFPFIYKNVSYSTCITKDDPDGKHWCSTRTDSHNNHIKDNFIICSSAVTIDSRIGASGKSLQCETLPNPGECRGSFPRFFYNATSDQCDCFLYGGCDDEEPQSSWLTLADCSATCQPDNAEEGPRCKQILNQDDIQTFKQPNIVDAPDLSHLNDTALLDMFGDIQTSIPESPSVCQFPFIYKNVSYSKCTTKDDPDGQPWCSTSTDIHNNHIKDNFIICNESVHKNTVDIGDHVIKGNVSTNLQGYTRQPGCYNVPDAGECRGALPRFYYNQSSDQCDCFLFGGCDEELVASTWLTFEECLVSCVPANKTKGGGCQRVSLEEVQRFLES